MIGQSVLYHLPSGIPPEHAPRVIVSIVDPVAKAKALEEFCGPSSRDIPGIICGTDENGATLFVWPVPGRDAKEPHYVHNVRKGSGRGEYTPVTASVTTVIHEGPAPESTKTGGGE